MRQHLEYLPVWLLLHAIGALPRSLAHTVGIGLAMLVRVAHPKLRRVGMRNLEIAFPEMPEAERKRILRAAFRGIGRQLGEFCLVPRYTAENVSQYVVYNGLENFERAYAQGKGVLVLTGHFGGWEIGSFAHSLYGHPMKIVVRDLDNKLLDDLVRSYRMRHGNSTVDNRDYARALLKAMRAGETIGILMDTNMTPPQGVFVDFFGTLACTASGLARLALHTGAVVIPGYTLWDEQQKKYVIHFEPALTTLRTGDAEADVLANTAAYTNALEAVVRRYPEQWLWIHRRWKTRPPGGEPLY
jgi:Kdo2-lipid IVA lauroyltransferase/acyltransferase